MLPDTHDNLSACDICLHHAALCATQTHCVLIQMPEGNLRPWGGSTGRESPISLCAVIRIQRHVRASTRWSRQRNTPNRKCSNVTMQPFVPQIQSLFRLILQVNRQIYKVTYIQCSIYFPPSAWEPPGRQRPTTCDSRNVSTCCRGFSTVHTCSDQKEERQKDPQRAEEVRPPFPSANWFCMLKTHRKQA